MQTQAAGRRAQIQRIATNRKLYRRAGCPFWRRLRLRTGDLVVAKNNPILHMNRDRVLRMFFIQRSIDDPSLCGGRDGFLDSHNPPILPERLGSGEPAATDRHNADQQEDDERNALHSVLQFTGLYAPSHSNRTPLNFSAAGCSWYTS